MTKTKDNTVLRFAIVIGMAVALVVSAMMVAEYTGDKNEAAETHHISYQSAQTVDVG